MENTVWLSYEDLQVEQEMMRQREIEVLYEMGLGWLVEFCSHEIKK